MSKVIGQYFGLFHGCSKDHFDKIVASAPFDRCNLLILAFVHVADMGGGMYGPAFANTRDNCFNKGKAMMGDTDEDRIKLVLAKARSENPTLKILLSLGWYNEVVRASRHPEFFAKELGEWAMGYGLDGFDIDWEDTPNTDRIPDPFGPADFVKLMQCVQQEFPMRTSAPPIFTLTPATDRALDKSVLDCFTYVMPQTYGHGGNETTVTPYYTMLNSYQKIVYGLSSEGYKAPSDYEPDDPAQYARGVKNNGAAGVFSWRLDTDTMRKQPPKGQPEGDDQLPTFEVANKMWKLMNS